MLLSLVWSLSVTCLQQINCLCENMQSLNLIWERNVRKKKECKEKILPCFKRNHEIIYKIILMFHA